MGQDSGQGEELHLELTQAEAELLLKACKRYRSTIPTYLKSRADELRIIDRLIDKMTP